MTPFLKKTSQCWFITIADQQGEYHRRSTGTRDKATAQAMQNMVTELSRRGARAWDIIGAIVDRRVPLARVYDCYPEQLDAIRAEISDVDLAPAVDAWEANLAARVASGDLAASTMAHYVRQAAIIFPFEGEDEDAKRLPVRRSTLTADFFRDALANVGGSGTNRRRHAAGWGSVLRYLVEAGKLERNPLDDITLPKNNKAQRPRIERLDDVIRFVNRCKEGPHRAAAAFREGAGVEIQAVINTRRRDIVDEQNRVIWAHGEKNEFRDRQVIVEEWAFKIIMAYVKANPMHPDAPLFGDLTERSHRYECYRVRDELRAQGVNIPANYKLHSCRNTFAVRWLTEGKDPVLGAINLGHSGVSEMLRLYGKHRPRITDLVRADQRGKKEG